MTDETAKPAAADPTTPELIVRVVIKPQGPGVFEAQAVCEVGGERFTGTAADANNSPGSAMSLACARAIHEAGLRWEKFEQLGPDVVIRKKSRSLAEALGQLFMRSRTAPALPSASGRTLVVGAAADGGAVVAGVLVDDDDDDDDDEGPAVKVFR